METIGENASYIRSKNAGPFWLTFDLFFDDAAKYQAVCRSANLNQAAVAALYGTDAAHVKLFFLDALQVIKVSLPRRCAQGGPTERDMHGGQQYVELAALKV